MGWGRKPKTNPNAGDPAAATTAKPRRQISLPFGIMEVIYVLCGVAIVSTLGVCVTLATHMPTQTVNSAIYLTAGIFGLTVVAILVGVVTQRDAG